MVPPPPEDPTFNIYQMIVIPHSTSELVLNISGDQHHALDPIFKLTGPYGCTHPPDLSLNTKKPVMTEKQEKMTKELRSLELSIRNVQGLEGYKSVSYKDLCMFLGINLPLGFKMLKLEKYDWLGDPVAHLRCYCNQLRGAGEKEKLLMVYFGQSLPSLTSEWFIDQDIDK